MRQIFVVEIRNGVCLASREGRRDFACLCWKLERMTQLSISYKKATLTLIEVVQLFKKDGSQSLIIDVLQGKQIFFPFIFILLPFLFIFPPEEAHLKKRYPFLTFPHVSFLPLFLFTFFISLRSKSEKDLSLPTFLACYQNLASFTLKLATNRSFVW